jgi:hypothetical protein
VANVIRMQPKDDDPDKEPIIVDAETGEILDAEGDPTGRSIEDLADEYVPPFFVRGSQPQLSLDVGSEVSVVGSVLKIKAQEVPLLGQYKVGERVRLLVEVEVEDVNFKGIRSKYTGDLVGLDRIHVGSVETARDEE